jgi:hypothetical protein
MVADDFGCAENFIESTLRNFKTDLSGGCVNQSAKRRVKELSISKTFNDVISTVSLTWQN